MTIVTPMVNGRQKIFDWAMDDWANSIVPLLTLPRQRGNDSPRTPVKSLGETCRTLLSGNPGKAGRLGESPLP
jgi:hypothetical protein